MVWPCWMLLARRTTSIALQSSDNRFMPLFSASAYLNLRKDAPHQDLQNPLNAFMGSGKSGPRLMCSGPCSLFTCLSSIVLSIKSAGKCCDQNTQSRSPSMWLTMLFSKQSERMPAKSAGAQGSHEILEAIITTSLSLPLLKRSINSISESSRRPLCTGLKGHVDPASRSPALLLGRTFEAPCLQQWQERTTFLTSSLVWFNSVSQGDLLEVVCCLYQDGWQWLKPHMCIQIMFPLGRHICKHINVYI